MAIEIEPPYNRDARPIPEPSPANANATPFRVPEVRGPRGRASRCGLPLACFALVALFSGVRAQDAPRQVGADWPYYGGNNAGNRYSPLAQINLDNVDQLEVAWTYNAAKNRDPDSRRPRQIQNQPVIIDGILYGTTPQLELFALDAATGEELWIFNPSAEFQGANSSNRGVMFWEDGTEKRILYAAGIYLHAIDALTGKPVESFGEGGKLDLHTGLEDSRPNAAELAITATTPGVIYKDIVIMGSTVSEAGDALPGDIRGFDVRTGKLLWTFHTIPRPGEFGYDTWEEGAYKNIGGANCWGGMTLDEERGVVYAGTGSPSPNFYGGDRKGKNLFANCILALNAETGERVWHYQLVHHDLWDWDPTNPPNLVTVNHDGVEIDALSLTTKDGLIYVLNRDTGESLFPVEERPVPVDGVPGEEPWPVQKFPLKPAPLTRQVYTKDDLPDPEHFPEAHAYIKERLEGVRHSEKYIPPSEEGTIIFGISGGAEWGGSAAAPDGVLYQNVNETPWLVRMESLAESLAESVSQGNDLYITYCAVCHGADRVGGLDGVASLVGIEDRRSEDELRQVIRMGSGRMPAFQHLSWRETAAIVDFLLNPEQEGERTSPATADVIKGSEERPFPYQAPYIRGRGGRLRDQDRYPGIKPPWGTLNAVDLNTGEYLWRVPLGEHPELTAKGIPVTGTENTGGPVVTAGGLLFIGATYDERFRAFNKDTGEIVWEYQLPAGAFATPATYSVDGRQYVVIAAGGARGGAKPGGWYMAFSLPPTDDNAR